MLYRLLHGQPLAAGVLGSHNRIHIVLAFDAVVEAGQQAVGVWRQVHAHNVCLLVGDMVKESGILVGKSVVVLLPYIGSQDKVQGSDWLPPGKLVGNLQPFCMLRCHGVHNTDKCLIACKETMASGQQVAFQPALAHMLAEHAVHNAPIPCQAVVIV